MQSTKAYTRIVRVGSCKIAMAYNAIAIRALPKNNSDGFS